MVKNEMSIIIKRPVEEVFSFVSDLQNGPQWQTGLFEVRLITKDPIGIGSQFAAVRKFLGRKLEANVEIVTFEPNHKLVFKGPSGSVPFEESFIFEAVADGTKVTDQIELHTSGFMGLAEPLIAGSLKREVVNNLGDLKVLLENQLSAAAA